MQSATPAAQHDVFGVLAGIIAVGVSLSTLTAAESKPAAAESKTCCWRFPWLRVTNSSAGNGIAVDAPKVFDNRSLVLMVEQLDEHLSRLTTVDQAKLAQSIGLLQGMQASDVARSLSVSTLPLPGTQLTEQQDTNSNQLAPQQKVTTTATYSPTVPTLPTESLPSISQSGYGIAAQDILSEQINLSYQVLNLRMLLERSVSDRIHKTAKGETGPRAQAVLGFQVSLDPLRQHKNRAAVVEVELKRVNTDKKKPSLVSLMPQAKTYNVAGLSKKSHAFGASAVVKVVTIGYGERHSAQSYYLYRDTDTVAFHRPSDAEALVFGWEFRPVLNRKAVEPGVRQLFAVVALDELDSLAVQSDFSLGVKVRTYWAKFDKKNAVITSEPCDLRCDSHPALLIPCSQTIQQSLSPKIQKVVLKPVGESSALIDVSGNNFYNGTTVAIGGKLLDPSNPAFLIKDDHLVQIFASATDLANGGIVLRGRYGTSAEVIDTTSCADMPDEFDLGVVFPSLIQKGHNSVTLKLYAPIGTNAPNLRGRTVVVAIGQQGFVLESASWRPTGKSLETHVDVKSEYLQEGTPAAATIPFVRGRHSRITISAPVTVENAVLLLDQEPQVWGITGRGFERELIEDPQTVVTADKDYTFANKALVHVRRELLQISVPKAEAAKVRNLSVKIGSLPAVILPAPNTPAAPPKVTLDASPVPTVAVNSASVVEFTGTSLEQVTKVTFGTSSLPQAPDKDGRKLRVFLNRDVTAKPGRVSLLVEVKDGTILAANIDVNN